MSRQRSKERAEFLSDLLVTAIEHYGYGFPAVIEYHPKPNGDPTQTYAVIFDRYALDGDTFNDGRVNMDAVQKWRVDIDTIAKGLGVVRKLEQPLADRVADVKAADRTNGDDGDIDVNGALMVLECALFGKPVYS